MTDGDIQVLIAVLMFVTAGLTAFATWRAPLSAAELAEKLRQASDKVGDQRRLRLEIFTTLMQERAAYWSVDATRAFNSIDIVFHDCRAVRDKWAQLFQTFSSPQIPAHVANERLVALLSAMAAELGLAEGLRVDDFARIYYPKAIADEEELRALRRQEALARLTTNQTPAANTALQQWPPPPPRAVVGGDGG